MTIGSVYPPLPLFAGFTAFTPEVPKLYWDVKSQEQRYFMLCKEMHKLICYADAIAERLNLITADLDAKMQAFEEQVANQLEEQNQAINEQLAAQNELVQKSLENLKKYVDYRFDTIAEGVNVYDVTSGTYRPSDEAMRRLYSALAYDHTGNRSLVSEVAAMYDVSQLAEKTVYNVAWSNRDTITIDDQVPNL